jgi:hypothetical protein
MIGARSSKRESRSFAAILSIVLPSIMLLLLICPCTRGAASEVVSGSDLEIGSSGKKISFIIWIEFPSALEISSANDWISLYVPGMDEWHLGDPDFPFPFNWSDDGKRLTVRSGDRDLGGPFSLTVNIDTSITDKDGVRLFDDDTSEVVLNFGNTNRMVLDYGPMEIFLFFIMPFFLLVPIVIASEVVLRFTVGSKEKGQVHPTAETLLRLVDRSGRMLRLRLLITLSISVVVILAYMIIVGIALVNSMFAMVMTWAALLFLSPWIIVFVTSLLYIIYRREDIVWRTRLKRIKEDQERFLNDGRK